MDDVEPNLQFSRTQLNFIISLLEQLEQTRKASIKLAETRKVAGAIQQLKGYEKHMVGKGYWR